MTSPDDNILPDLDDTSIQVVSVLRYADGSILVDFGELDEDIALSLLARGVGVLTLVEEVEEDDE